MGAGASLPQTGDIFDEMITRSRGEIKRMCSPKVTSSTATPTKDPRGFQSPHLSEKAYSPRVSELRGEHSPRSSGRGKYSPRTGEARPSNLGKSPNPSNK